MKDGLMNKYVKDRQIDKWQDGWMDGWMDGWIDVWSGRSEWMMEGWI